MPTLDWLKQEFNYGYDSGNVLSWIPGLTRIKEEKTIGGSYRKVFFQAILAYLKPNSIVLELGPGKGSWTKAILRYIPLGKIYTVDFQDVTNWLHSENYRGRLICYQVEDNSLSILQDEYFDFFWSFGVLCHNNIKDIENILKNSFTKMKPGAIAVHQYADWNKLEKYGWQRGRVPEDFKGMDDSQIWWPRNNEQMMSSLCVKLGWIVLSPDLNLVKRDGIIVLQRPLEENKSK